MAISGAARNRFCWKINRMRAELQACTQASQPAPTEAAPDSVTMWAHEWKTSQAHGWHCTVLKQDWAWINRCYMQLAQSCDHVTVHSTDCLWLPARPQSVAPARLPHWEIRDVWIPGLLPRPQPLCVRGNMRWSHKCCLSAIIHFHIHWGSSSVYSVICVPFNTRIITFSFCFSASGQDACVAAAVRALCWLCWSGWELTPTPPGPPLCQLSVHRCFLLT